MTTPDYEQLLTGSTRWVGQEAGVPYRLNHHGYNDGAEDFSHKHPGIWCYYLTVNELHFPPEIWKDFAIIYNEDLGWPEQGPNWDHEWFAGGISYCEQSSFWLRKTIDDTDQRKGRVIQSATVGCDYNHSWDNEMGYHMSLDSVRRRAEEACRQLASAFPSLRVRCRYSGRWGDKSEFYIAHNGSWVHNDAKKAIRADMAKSKGAWASRWLPARDQQAKLALKLPKPKSLEPEFL